MSHCFFRSYKEFYSATLTVIQVLIPPRIVSLPTSFFCKNIRSPSDTLMSTSVNGTLMYSPRPVCIDEATSVPPLVAPDFLINTEYHPYHGSVHNVNTLNETSTLDTPCPITTAFPLYGSFTSYNSIPIISLYGHRFYSRSIIIPTTNPFTPCTTSIISVIVRAVYIIRISHLHTG